MKTLNFCNDANCLVRPHAVNCPQCFGFGLKKNDVPITAHEVLETPWGEGELFKVCPICGGTPIKAPRQTHTTDKREKRPL